MIRQYKLKDYNFRLVLVLMVRPFIGVLLVGSAEPSLQKKQFAGMILGLTVMVIVSLMDYSWILNFNWIMYGGILILLLLVIFLELMPMALPVGLISAVFSSSLLSFAKLYLFSFLPNSLWIMRRI